MNLNPNNNQHVLVLLDRQILTSRWIPPPTREEETTLRWFSFWYFLLRWFFFRMMMMILIMRYTGLPKLSWSNRVNLESRYGTCTFDDVLVDSEAIHRPSVCKLKLIFVISEIWAVYDHHPILSSSSSFLMVSRQDTTCVVSRHTYVHVNIEIPFFRSG